VIDVPEELTNVVFPAWSTFEAQKTKGYTASPKTNNEFSRLFGNLGSLFTVIDFLHSLF
jgi:hypothetical protein